MCGVQTAGNRDDTQPLPSDIYQYAAVMMMVAADVSTDSKRDRRMTRVVMDRWWMNVWMDGWMDECFDGDAHGG